MSVSVKTNENISIVTFNSVPASFESSFICVVFEQAAKAGINIDMISQAPATSDNISFGFTFPDDDMPKLLSIINNISESKSIKPMLNVGNVKITIQSNDMINNTGFAFKVFNSLREIDCLPLLVTTSIDDISILVYESYVNDLVNTLNKNLNNKLT